MSVVLAHTASATISDRARPLVGLFARTADAHDRAGSFPFENFRHLAEAGLLALRTPLAFGGAGGNLRDATAVIGLVAQGEPATALVLAMHYIQHASIARSTRWPAHLRERLARETAVGASLINILRVEPELGTPARGGLPETTAVRTPDGWRLSGRKIYSTGAPILSWMNVWAKTDEADPRVGVFLVPTGLEGIAITETWDHLGLRASGSHDVTFDDVLLPADHAADIRKPNEWAGGEVLQQHNEGSLLIAALYNGVAIAARDWLVSFLKSRVPTNLGAPLASLPRMQEALGAIELLLTANARLIDGLASDLDAGAQFETDAHAVKSIVTNNAAEAVEQAIRLCGNHGLTRANPLQRHYRDVLCGRVHTPQDDVVRLTLGRRALA